MNPPKQTIVKVCTNTSCKCNGSEKVLDTLSKNLPKNYTVSQTEDCFRFCKEGPNVAVNGQVLHHIHPENAINRITKETLSPTVKKDVIGTRNIDELDDVLDSITQI